jgi:hypothetical protein
MLPPPPAAPRRDEIEHGPKAPSTHSSAAAAASEQAAPSPAPLGASLVPVAFTPIDRHAERNEEGPTRKSRRLAFVLLPAAAAIVLGGLGFAASYADEQPSQGAQHVFPPLGQLAEVTAARAVTPPREASTAAVGVPTGDAQPSEIIIRREPATPGPDDLVAP